MRKIQGQVRHCVTGTGEGTQMTRKEGMYEAKESGMACSGDWGGCSDSADADRETAGRFDGVLCINVCIGVVFWGNW